MLQKTVFGQPPGTQKTPSSQDKPARVIWNSQKGVFLTEEQEELTLDQLLAKEEYKNNYIAQYWINKALEEQLAERDKMISKYESDLFKCETTSINAVDNMVLYKNHYETAKSENEKLKSELKGYKWKYPLFKVGTVTFGITTLTLGTLYLLSK